MHQGPLLEADWQPNQPTTVHIKFVLPVSGLPSSVEAQTSATHASLCFCSRSPMLHSDSSPPLAYTCSRHYINLRETFECDHLKFMVSGWSKHSRPDTRVYNVVTQPQRSTYKYQLGSLVPRLLPMYKNGERAWKIFTCRTVLLCVILCVVLYCPCTLTQNIARHCKMLDHRCCWSCGTCGSAVLLIKS